jgi:hypothetical protein
MQVVANRQRESIFANGVGEETEPGAAIPLKNAAHNRSHRITVLAKMR